MKTFSLVSRAALVIALTAGTAAVAQDAPPSPGDSPAAGSEIIVTGTRATGVTVAESAAPIKLVGAEAISHVGQPNLNNVLTQLVPSFTAQGFGGDAANLTLSASLRGLNPNETLVLVNGKRRHGTGNLQILASPFQGGAAPDLDFITPASVDHIEVLEDGAAAQYGSDAIAGVINIIMKHKDGGLFSATGGQFYAGDGKTYSSSLNYGWSNDRGFVNLTGFYRVHNHTNRGKYDFRVYDPTTADGLPAGVTGQLGTDYQSIPGYPNVNPIVGDAHSKFGVGSYNAGYDLTPDTHFYSFGSIGFRNAESYENTRLSDRIIGSNNVDPTTGLFLPGSNYNATIAADPSLIPFPSGFKPQEAIREVDYQFVGGLKGDIGDWHWDLSTSYGQDREKVYTLDSANRSLFWDTHVAGGPDFYDGAFKATEWTSNLDITRQIGTFATLAGGAEYRQNTYSISAGEPDSYYKTGAQSFPGYAPATAGNHKRHNYAFYGDVALTPIEGLKIDGAVRYEDYSDFGNKTTWKATGRYDFTPEIAIRGTASTGFRAPTLGEEYYTQVNVSPTSATAQLAANSDAAKILGIQNLKPEKSTNYSAGFVFRPMPRVTVTVDAYQIKIRDRIVGSGSVGTQRTITNPDGTKTTINYADVQSAIDASGFSLETDQPNFVSAFINGPDTRTRGIDVVASYDADLGSAGRAAFTLSGAYNKTKITKEPVSPTQVAATGYNLINDQTRTFLETALPHVKIIGGVNWSIGDFSVVARETYYSKVSAKLDNDNDFYAYNKIKAAAITDLELDYHMTPKVTLAVGANNLFDKIPQKVSFDEQGVLSGDSVVIGAPLQFGPYGIDGGYYYARVDVKF